MDAMDVMDVMDVMDAILTLPAYNGHHFPCA